MSVSVPEPPPKDEGIFVTPLLIKWIQENANLSDDIKRDTVKLIEQRDAYGFNKYKQHLRTDDGRNTLEDARQEYGDLLQYLFKAIIRGEDDISELTKLMPVLNELTGVGSELRDKINEKDKTIAKLQDDNKWFEQEVRRLQDELERVCIGSKQ